MFCRDHAGTRGSIGLRLELERLEESWREGTGNGAQSAEANVWGRTEQCCVQPAPLRRAKFATANIEIGSSCPVSSLISSRALLGQLVIDTSGAHLPQPSSK